MQIGRFATQAREMYWRWMESGPEGRLTAGAPAQDFRTACHRRVQPSAAAVVLRPRNGLPRRNPGCLLPPPDVIDPCRRIRRRGDHAGPEGHTHGCPTQDPPRRLDDRHGLPPRGVAASGILGRRQHGTAARRARDADRRARAARHGLPRRWRRHPLQRRAGGRAVAHLQERAVRTADAAERAGDGDAACRPRGDGIDHLQRALSHRAEIRLARPHQRRARGVERGDQRDRHGGAEFRPGRRAAQDRPLRPRRRVRRGGQGLVGVLGGRRLHPRQGSRAELRPGEGPCR